MKTVTAELARKTITTAMIQEGVREEIAGYVSEGLVSTSLRGVDSHGIRLANHYLSVIKTGRINASPNYKVHQTKPTVAALDADDAFGHAAGMEAVRLAAKMAREYGSGHVAVFNSTHYGAAAYYALELAEQDMIGLSMTNTDALVIPTNGKRNFLGNNPLAFAAPIKDEGPFCLDMATSTITFNEVKRLRAAGEKAPEGVGADKNGQLSTDPNEITMLMPVGSYKGYGISLMIEVLCSALTGMPYGRHISKMFEDLSAKRYLGHYISAIDLNAFGDPEGFKERMKGMMEEIRNEPRLHEEQGIMVAGDPEKIVALNRKVTGIPLPDEDYKNFMALVNRYGVEA